MCMEDYNIIKAQCINIMNYYYINADTDENINNKIIGYYKNNKCPDIVVYIALDNNLNSGINYSNSVKNPQWIFIITNNPNNFNVTNVKNSTIFVCKPPSINNEFDEKIREITHQTSRKLYGNNNLIINDKNDDCKNILMNFENEIKSQCLDINIAKDIIFKAKLGGLKAGIYKNNKIETQFISKQQIPKELMYLKSREIIFEKRIGANYDSGRFAIYFISTKGLQLADCIVDERLANENYKLKDIITKYGENAVLISLVGNIDLITAFKCIFYLDNYSIFNSILGITYSIPIFDIKNREAEYINKKFNIDPDLYFMITIINSSPEFRNINLNIFSELINNNLGDKKGHITSKGDSAGTAYYIPLNILEYINISQWALNLDTSALKDFSKWAILRSSHKLNLNIFKAINVELDEVIEMVNETFRAGITSKILNNDENTFAIYDDKKFKEFCTSKIEDTFNDMINKDD